MLSAQRKYEIIEKYKNGNTMNQIAISMAINEKTVIRWLKRYINNNNVDRKKREYKKKTTIEDDKLIMSTAAKDDKFTLQTIKNKLKDDNIIISKTTIWRRLKDDKYIYGNYLKKPELKEEHKIARVEWAKKYTDFDWSKVLFSDEATIYLNSVGKCWYKIGQRKVFRTSKKIIKRNIWAFINLSVGVGDYNIFNENLNADIYENILAEHLVVSYKDELFYQQDNHSVHKSKKITQFMKDNNISVIDWPAYSPDINPIENLWSIIKRKLKEKTLTKENFDASIKETIDNIDLSIIYNMISNMHVRLQKIIDSGGDIIDY
jgi:transposase